ncbi:MAG: hypothetical protein ACFHX7_00260 [Pseudomonadota bacterium]
MWVLAFFLLFIVEITILLIYVRQLRSVADYSSEHMATIAGKKYGNVYELYADLGFLSFLFNGDLVTGINDDNLLHLTAKARKLLYLQMVVGVGIFATGIMSGMTS